jgi:O-antigen ligase
VRNLVIVCLIVGFASAGVALMQHFGSIAPFPLIQSVPHAETPTDFGDWGGRALGLTESPIYLSNSMLLLMLPLTGVLLISEQKRDTRVALVIVLLCLVMALYYSYTRSWTYAAAAGTVPFLILYRGRYLKHLWLGLLLGGVVFFMWTGYQGNRYTLGANEDSSASGRYVLWEIGLQVALDNPIFGVGHNVFTSLAPEYADRIDSETLERQKAAEVIGVYEPHNDFLNVWLSFGTFGLLLYLAVFYMTGKNFLAAFNTSDSPLMKGLALGSAGALLAFAVNSSFHNLLDSTLTLWLLAGFSAALANIAATRPGVLPESLEVTRSTTPGRAGTRQKGSLRPSFGED